MGTKFFKKITDRIKNLSLVWKRVISFGFVFLFSFLVFFAGSAKSESHIEKAAQYITEVVKNKGEGEELFSFQLVAEDKESESALPRVYDEYFYWKYIFRHSDFSYLATVNGGKTHECYYSEIDCDRNITFIYSGNNLNREKGDHYKHEVYDFDLMFKGETQILNGTISFLIVSQTRANQLLAKRLGCDEDSPFTKEDYQSLISTETSMMMDGNEVKFTISNIYLEDGDFFENTKKLLDEFIISYTIFPADFEKEYTYIFNGYVYQNYHKLLRINEMIKGKNFLIRTNEEIDNFELIGNNLIAKQGNDFIAIFFVIIITLIYFALISFFAISRLYLRKWHISFLWIAFISPYLLFNLINLIKPIPLLFSFFSLKVYIIHLLVLVCLTVYLLIKKGVIGHEKTNK